MNEESTALDKGLPNNFNESQYNSNTILQPNDPIITDEVTLRSTHCCPLLNVSCEPAMNLSKRMIKYQYTTSFEK